MKCAFCNRPMLQALEDGPMTREQLRGGTP